MKISTGAPPEPGRYAVYLTTDAVASTVRYWDGARWVPHLTDEKGRFPHDVTGWIGPLPARKIQALDEFVKQEILAVAKTLQPAALVEYDL